MSLRPATPYSSTAAWHSLNCRSSNCSRNLQFAILSEICNSMDGGSDYDRLFYPFLFAGGTASAADVLTQVRHSTLEKSREMIALRRATLEQSGDRIIAAGVAM